MQPDYHGLTLLPPSPVSENATIDLRLGLIPNPQSTGKWKMTLFLDEETTAGLITAWEQEIKSPDPVVLVHNFSGHGRAGHHHIIAVITLPDGTILRIEKPLEILAREALSTGIIDGAFAGFYHWSEEEGRLWNAEIAEMTEDDWSGLLRTQHDLGMNILVPQEAFRNQEYVGRHAIERKGYKGRAFYPSKLGDGRMPIACNDPIETILSTADELGMNVFLPIGLYAWFDFTPGSLKWHKEVTRELWDRYGHHPSVYGFYVGEEIGGDLGMNNFRRQEIVSFFREYTPFARSLAPDKVVMLASNCHNVPDALDWYPRLLQNLDVLCPFAFHRMPPYGQTGEEAAAMLQELCDSSGCHLWLDLEAFFFKPDMALYPCPVEHLIDNLERFTMFEKIICYQFPGLFNAPEARLKPGGPATVALYNAYCEYLHSRAPRNPAEQTPAGWQEQR